MQVKTKTILLLSFVISVSVITAIFLFILQEGRFDLIFVERKKEEEVAFSQLLTLKGKSLENLAFNYSYWDELVRFVEKQDMAWAETMLNKAVLKTYDASAIWIYKPDLSLIYSINNLEATALESIPLNQEAFQAVSAKLSQERFCHFFLAVPEGLMEMRGATIHPTADPERKTPAKGYFFTSRLWDKDYLSALSKLSLAAVTLAPIREEPQGNMGEGIVAISQILTAWDKSPLMRINAWIKVRGIAAFHKASQMYLLFFFIFAGVIFFLVLFFAFHWIYNPLQLISRTLRREEVVYIDKLRKSSTEFGDISQLVYNFFKQRAKLASEISERKQIEERLAKINECFLKFKDDPQENIRHLVVLCGELLQATCVLYNRLEGGFLCSAGQWNAPLDYKPADKPEGRICYDVIQRARDNVFVIRNLPQTKYAQTDPNVMAYNLKTYMGKAVKCGNAYIGSLCAVYQNDFEVSQEDQKLVGIIASAISVEEERRKAEETLKDAYSQLKATQAQIIQSAKMASVGQLASGVAHEVNNPLTGVLNNIQLMKQKIGRRPDFNATEFQEILGVVEESALRCKNIIQSLLDFSRQARGPFQHICLNETIEKVMSLIEHELRAESITLQKELQPKLPKILGDAQLLEQAIFNLIADTRWAIKEKAQKPGSLIIIQTQYQQESDTVLLSISDTGIGIPKENLDRIFEPFFTTKPIGQGVGLGLPIVYNIIKQHQGNIEVESERDKGTTFKVTLPCFSDKNPKLSKT